MIPAPALEALRDAFGERLLLDEPLAKHTSARIGGPADAFLVAHTIDDLRRAAAIAWAHNVPLTVLGGGSNILISDRGVRGLVLHNRTNRITFGEAAVTADSGVGLMTLARRCIKRGLAGLEWAIGVPGTLGGALYGNAGAHGGDMQGSTRTVTLITPQGDRVLSGEEMGFAYRSSALKRERRPALILGAELALTPEEPAAIQARADAFTAHRRRTQPPGATLGSTFKNPPGDYAGRLIEAAGLKGTQRGGARISELHANFFLNVENATAGDVMALIEYARAEVLRHFGVLLELEIELVGEW
ncbi:MAG: UDP-N-acetylmuramate dehydrogenase [Anaerolineae bacterium]